MRRDLLMDMMSGRYKERNIKRVENGVSIVTLLSNQ